MREFAMNKYTIPMLYTFKDEYIGCWELRLNILVAMAEYRNAQIHTNLSIHTENKTTESNQFIELETKNH